MRFSVGNNHFSYNPVFMAWGVGAYEADNARSLPQGTGNENLNVILSGDKFYYVITRGFAGENDEWFSQVIPVVYPGCYLKTFWDEVGT